MSYAVIQTGGKQYKVKAGEILKIEKLKDTKPDQKIEFKEILAYGDDSNIEVGSPLVSGAKVEANLIKNYKPKYNIGKIDSKFIRDGDLISLTIKNGTDTKAPKKVAKKVIEKESICLSVL